MDVKQFNKQLNINLNNVGIKRVWGVNYFKQ